MNKVPITPALWWVLLLMLGCGEHRTMTPTGQLRVELGQRIARHSADVSVYYRTLSGEDSLLLNPDIRMHAASTMKVPLMLQLYREAMAGRLDLDRRIPVTTRFASIVDGSPYDIDPQADSDQALYERVGDSVSRRELIDRMITRSSNLATNLLIAEAGAERVTALCRELGADSIEVLRGVADLKAFRAGLSNTTTARDLGVIMTALAIGQVADAAGTHEMVEILKRQHFNDGIPAGLPEGVTVAHKTGRITAIEHDAAVVYPPNGPPFVLIIMVRGLEDPAEATRLIADLAGMVYRTAVPAT